MSIDNNKILKALENAEFPNRHGDFIRLLNSLGINPQVNTEIMARLVALHKILLQKCADEGRFFDLFRSMATLMKGKVDVSHRHQWLEDFVQFSMTEDFVVQFKSTLTAQGWGKEVNAFFQQNEYECLDLLPEYMLQRGDIYAYQGMFEDACLYYRKAFVENPRVPELSQKAAETCNKVIAQGALHWKQQENSSFHAYYSRIISEERHRVFNGFQQRDPSLVLKSLQQLQHWSRDANADTTHPERGFFQAIWGNFFINGYLSFEETKDELFLAWDLLWKNLIKELSSEPKNIKAIKSTTNLLNGLSILCEWMVDGLMGVGILAPEKAQEFFIHFAGYIKGEITYRRTISGQSATTTIEWLKSDDIKNQLDQYWPERNKILTRLSEKAMKSQALSIEDLKNKIENAFEFPDINTFLTELSGVIEVPYKQNPILLPARLLNESHEKLKDLSKSMPSLTQSLRNVTLPQKVITDFIQNRALWLNDAKALIQFLWNSALDWINLPPPCAYSLGLLGSFARGEAALCSDMECIIVLGPDETGEFTGKPQSFDEFKLMMENPVTMDYFHLVFRLFRSAVILLDESDAPDYMIHKKGLRFDLNFNPFIRPAEKEIFIGTLQNITPTISSLPNLFEQDLDKASIVDVSILCDACFLEGNENLLEAYVERRNHSLSKELDQKNRLQRHKIAFSFWDERVGSAKGKTPDEWHKKEAFKVKDEGLAVLSSVVKTLSIYYGINAENTYERIEKLKNENKLESNTAEGLKVALAWIDQLRCWCHQYYNTEQDTLCLWDDKPKGFYPLGLKNINVWQTLMCIYHDVIAPIWHTMEDWINRQKQHWDQEENKPFKLNSENYLAWNQARGNGKLEDRAIKIMVKMLTKVDDPKKRSKEFNEKMIFWWPRWLRLLSQFSSQKVLQYNESLYLELEIPERIVFLEAWRSLNTPHNECTEQEVEKLLSIKSEMLQVLATIPSPDGWSGMMYLKEKNWREGVSELFAESLEESSIEAKINAGEIVIGCRNPISPVDYTAYESPKENNSEKACGLFLLKNAIKNSLIEAEKKAFSLSQDELDRRRHIILFFQHKTKNNTLYRFCLKIFPENPGMEYAINQLQYRLGGNEIPDVWLWRIYSKTYPRGIAAILMEDVHSFSLSDSDSKMIKNFQEAFFDRQSFENISDASFTRHFLRVLLTLPEDDKPNDYFLIPQELKGEYHRGERGFSLGRVDNERSFYLGEIFSANTTGANRSDLRQRELQTKTAIFCMNNMGSALDNSVLKRFYEILKMNVSEKWLLSLMRWNEDARAIFKCMPVIDASLSLASRKLIVEEPSLASSLWHYERSVNGYNRYHQGIFNNGIFNPLAKKEKDNFCLTVMPFPEDRFFNFISAWESIYHYCSDMETKQPLFSITGHDILINVRSNLHRHYHEALPNEGKISRDNPADPRTLFWRFDKITYPYYQNTFQQGWSFFRSETPSFYKMTFDAFQLWLRGIDLEKPIIIQEISTKPSASTFGKLMTLASGKNYTTQDYLNVVLERKVGMIEPETPVKALNSLLGGRIADYLCWNFLSKTLSRDILEIQELNDAYAFFYNLPLLQQQEVVKRFLTGDEYKGIDLPAHLQKRLVNLLLNWKVEESQIRLEKLDLRRLSRITTREPLIALLHCFKNELKELKIVGKFCLFDPQFINAINTCEKLIRLTLDDYASPPSFGWRGKLREVRFEGTLYHVKELELSRQQYLREINLITPKLRKLVLKNNNSLTKANIATMVLKTLNIASCARFSDEALQGIISICRVMPELYLKETAIKNPIFLFLNKNAPHLFSVMSPGQWNAFFRSLNMPSPEDLKQNDSFTKAINDLENSAVTVKLGLSRVIYTKALSRNSMCSFHGHQFDPLELLVLSALLAKNKTVKSLDLSGCRISGAMFLFKSLEKNTTLEVLDLRYCDLENTKYFAQQNSKEKYKTLQFINFDLNSPSPSRVFYRETNNNAVFLKYLENIQKDNSNVLDFVKKETHTLIGWAEVVWALYHNEVVRELIWFKPVQFDRNNFLKQPNIEKSANSVESVKQAPVSKLQDKSIIQLLDGRFASIIKCTSSKTWCEEILFCDKETGRYFHSNQGHSASISVLTQLRDGRLASGDDAGTIKLWDVNNGHGVMLLSGHRNKILAFTQLKDGCFVSADSRGTIKLWDINMGVCFMTFRGHKSAISTIAQHPDGRLITSDDNNCSKSWDVAPSIPVTLDISFRYQLAKKFSLMNTGQMIFIASNSNVIPELETAILFNALENFVNLLIYNCYPRNTHDIIININREKYTFSIFSPEKICLRFIPAEENANFDKTAEKGILYVTPYNGYLRYKIKFPNDHIYIDVTEIPSEGITARNVHTIKNTLLELTSQYGQIECNEDIIYHLYAALSAFFYPLYSLKLLFQKVALHKMEAELQRLAQSEHQPEDTVIHSPEVPQVRGSEENELETPVAKEATASDSSSLGSSSNSSSSESSIDFPSSSSRISSPVEDDIKIGTPAVNESTESNIPASTASSSSSSSRDSFDSPIYSSSTSSPLKEDNAEVLSSDNEESPSSAVLIPSNEVKPSVLEETISSESLSKSSACEELPDLNTDLLDTLDGIIINNSTRILDEQAKKLDEQLCSHQNQLTLYKNNTLNSQGNITFFAPADMSVQLRQQTDEIQRIRQSLAPIEAERRAVAEIQEKKLKLLQHPRTAISVFYQRFSKELFFRLFALLLLECGGDVIQEKPGDVSNVCGWAESPLTAGANALVKGIDALAPVLPFVGGAISALTSGAKYIADQHQIYRRTQATKSLIQSPDTLSIIAEETARCVTYVYEELITQLVGEDEAIKLAIHAADKVIAGLFKHYDIFSEEIPLPEQFMKLLSHFDMCHTHYQELLKIFKLPTFTQPKLETILQNSDDKPIYFGVDDILRHAGIKFRNGDNIYYIPGKGATEKYYRWSHTNDVMLEGFVEGISTPMLEMVPEGKDQTVEEPSVPSSSSQPSYAEHKTVEDLKNDFKKLSNSFTELQKKVHSTTSPSTDVIVAGSDTAQVFISRDVMNGEEAESREINDLKIQLSQLDAMNQYQNRILAKAIEILQKDNPEFERIMDDDAPSHYLTPEQRAEKRALCDMHSSSSITSNRHRFHNRASSSLEQDKADDILLQHVLQISKIEFDKANIKDKRNLFGLQAYETCHTSGDCLFASVAAFMPNETAMTIRQRAVNYIPQDKQLTFSITTGINSEELLTKNGKRRYNSLQEYITLMSLPQTWGTYIELLALSKSIARPIVILTPGNQHDSVIEEKSFKNKEPIFLNYVRQSHYEPLSVPENRNSHDILQHIREAIEKRNENPHKYCFH